jgi:hypothetical protein
MCGGEFDVFWGSTAKGSAKPEPVCQALNGLASLALFAGFLLQSFKSWFLKQSMVRVVQIMAKKGKIPE